MQNVFSAVPGKHVWVSGLHSGGLVGANPYLDFKRGAADFFKWGSFYGLSLVGVDESRTFFILFGVKGLNYIA
jgi:hypothetical protein